MTKNAAAGEGTSYYGISFVVRYKLISNLPKA